MTENNIHILPDRLVGHSVKHGYPLQHCHTFVGLRYFLVGFHPRQTTNQSLELWL